MCLVYACLYLIATVLYTCNSYFTCSQRVRTRLRFSFFSFFFMAIMQKGMYASTERHKKLDIRAFSLDIFSSSAQDEFKTNNRIWNRTYGQLLYAKQDSSNKEHLRGWWNLQTFGTPCTATKVTIYCLSCSNQNSKKLHFNLILTYTTCQYMYSTEWQKTYYLNTYIPTV